jgi:DMSO/TMAO reductase YedYZ molybdopterin-dependent catalytic subunit
MSGLSRRKYVALALAAPAFAGKRQLGSSPVISVQDFEQYPALLTPVQDFFVRNHFDVPALETATWVLPCGGSVKRQRTFSLADLKAFPRHEVTCVFECAGNGVGVGAVGCVHWAGVRLSDVLNACGIGGGSRFVRVTGADRGREPDAREVQYARSLAVEEAMRPDNLLALEMHGRPLGAEHGAPVRLVAPGRYGMDSVKWIERIEVLDGPDDSFFMANRFRRVSGGRVGEPVGRIAVKSNIVQPVADAVLRGDLPAAGGYAWAGADPVVRVEVRLDRGSWMPAELIWRPSELAWMPWRFPIRRLTPGAHTIEARAATRAGQVQPDDRDAGREDSYELNQVQRVHFFWRP